MKAIVRALQSRQVVAAAACGAALACSAEAPPPEITAPAVFVQRAVTLTVTDQIEATGQLLAQAEATVAAQVDGEVTGIAADEGTSVAAGQVIVEIDPERRQLELEDAGANVVQAEAQLAEARREAVRVEKLAGRGAVSQSQLDGARTQLSLARSRLVAAQAKLGLSNRALRDASVAAPFAGSIARRYVNVGEFVNVGQELYDLVALDPVEVEFHLSEVDSSRAALGQTVSVRVAPFADEVFEAQVTVVSPTIDKETRTRRVKAVVENPEGRLLPGTFARVDLGVAERTGVVMVPKEAVLERSDGSVVYRLVGEDRVERIQVRTGIHQGALVELRGDVHAGDPIVVRGHAGLIDGAAVSLRTADGKPASLDAVADVAPVVAGEGGQGG